jgi:polar amino acid transport system ATP-binding protein
VRKSYGEFQALQGINARHVAKGEVLCMIGPSGSGKSTFLRCINQLETITDGALWVNGELVGYRRVGNKLHPLSEKQVARQRLATGMVFQRFNLFPHMTALENVIEGPVQVLKRRRSEAIEEARALLDAGRAWSQVRCVSGRAVGRAAAARGHCTRACHASATHALRRTHLRA